MTLAEVVLSVMFLGLIAYGVFGGADFGAGIWDLLAGGTRRGGPQRGLIERSIAPIWEANHVWLIFVLVVLWTAFPGAFAAVVTTLYIPLTLAAFGMIARGAAFAFRKSVTTLGMRRSLGACFALSSLVTPYFLGAVVGGVASGRVPPGIAAGDVVTSWVNPTSVLGGVLAVLVCAYLAAVFLCADARREGTDDLAGQFRLRGLATAAVTGAVGIAGLFVLRADARQLFDGLTGRALPVVALSVVAGVAALGLLAARRYVPARAASALAVTAILVGWAVAQYPYVLVPELTIEEAAGGRSTLVAMLVALLGGSVVLLPALVYLYVLFQRAPRHDAAEPAAPGAVTS
ncbi:cytochrome d ubiquinol oxidase subunit II [Geodermatophilus sabuli]|uniref:Cytochrome bd-I ubiquinol oxidase subunit 2 apoprotein n=1 Tax=Geodermatophilus sabuli TaxID=1564158 RepID=A0A285EK14_9ACTN|nr:cytochrome d ubiquinol oxidase subunit II [Geodermatophilus sabuli]MBB3083853.1 cytochrome d ubiquinol oxidase subunit II [Geodermatophilus sabuli]SNX98504.1 cytochrome bd-I ubiquinol oxidase subunit 2 apoprotein [Geodermatophilus sabuli]